MRPAIEAAALPPPDALVMNAGFGGLAGATPRDGCFGKAGLRNVDGEVAAAAAGVAGVAAGESRAPWLIITPGVIRDAPPAAVALLDSGRLATTSSSTLEEGRPMM